MENENLLDEKIADIVAQNIQTAHVFKKYGIDFCCGGGISIKKACERKGIDVNVLLSDLKNISEKVLPSQNFNNWELDFLIDYIVNTHHAYVRESIKLIDTYATKVATVHGKGHPRVLEIQKLFSMVVTELPLHMKKEEFLLFPYIKRLVISKRNQTALIDSEFDTVNKPISVMIQDHENVGNLLKEISIISNEYTPPEWACNTFKALYAKLDEFEQDLHIHVHLENNILFPKAILLETTSLN